ncbi:hypothetical protein C2W62_05435 [Candidatus Entotheonella serta]|nr:hypothetical protein C2W62_05435 [Candidatus Entotheonella serta]
MIDSISVIIVTDYKLLSECLISALETSDHITVSAVTQDKKETLEQVETYQPDVVLIDVHLPNSMAITITQRLTQHAPSTKILLLRFIESQTNIQEYVEAGALGYVLKSSSPEELKLALKLVVHGETMCSPQGAYELFSELADLARAQHRNKSHESFTLSSRELGILKSIADGDSNRQIADRLHLSQHTVKNHVHNILKKLHVRRRSEAVKYASQKNWL